MTDGITHTSLTKVKLAVRKESGNLTTTERVEYINTVLCLQSNPSKLSYSVASAAEPRYDDFVAIDNKQT
ncbi:uncharacterized protein BDZ99DRAFT_457180, partial [Mytilinidion resinicola]